MQPDEDNPKANLHADSKRFVSPLVMVTWSSAHTIMRGLYS